MLDGGQQPYYISRRWYLKRNLIPHYRASTDLTVVDAVRKTRNFAVSSRAVSVRLDFRFYHYFYYNLIEFVQNLKLKLPSRRLDG